MLFTEGEESLPPGSSYCVFRAVIQLLTLAIVALCAAGMRGNMRTSSLMVLSGFLAFAAPAQAAPSCRAS